MRLYTTKLLTLSFSCITYVSALAPPLTKHHWISQHSRPHQIGFDCFRRPFTIYASSDDGDDDVKLQENTDEDTSMKQQSSDSFQQAQSSILDRFLSPKIDDPGLPLTDVLLAQIVAPSLQTFWIFAAHAPSPSWLRPLSSYFGEAPELAPRGSLLAPTLIHGAGLAVCWLAGALAARMYEREAFELKEVGGGKVSIWGRLKSYDAVSKFRVIYMSNSLLLVSSEHLNFLLQIASSITAFTSWSLCYWNSNSKHAN
jgi:hypothetical protein